VNQSGADARGWFRSHLLSRGARFAGDIVVDFGDLQAEREALEHAATLHPLCADGLIRVNGPDAREFLQSQLSNDIGELDAKRAQLTTWCSAQGRMLATFLAWREQEDYLLQLPLELVAPVKARLERFVLRARVRLHDASGTRALAGIGGPGAAVVLEAGFGAAPAEPMGLSEAGPGAVLIALRDNLYQIALAPDSAQASWDDLSARARPAGTPGWTWRRIAACLPSITAATQDRFVPQMADMERIGAISFSKGCYPGQEIVARSQYLGQVKRRLFRVHAAQAQLAPGQDILAGSAIAGTLVNAAAAPRGGHDALAVLQLDAAARADLTMTDGAAVRVVAACH
jgi:tRNA-modifying protein YgfZ